MKKGIQIFLGLTLLAALAEGLILIRIRIDPWRVAALMESAALLMGAFVGLTQPAFIKQLRHWSMTSPLLAGGLPFLLLVPYLIMGLGTGTFSPLALGKVIAYILVPTALLLPDRLRHREGLNWRDVLAMLALAVPVSAGWLQGIWIWPQDLYVFRPIFCVLVGGYAFMVLRNLDGVGFRLVWRQRDISYALLNLLAFTLLAIPMGIGLGFIHPHSTAALTHFGDLGLAGNFFFLFIGIYLTVAIPEEFFSGESCKTSWCAAFTRGRGAFTACSSLRSCSAPRICTIRRSPIGGMPFWPRWRDSFMGMSTALGSACAPPP